MKGFAVSVVLLILLSAFVTVNSVIVCNRIDGVIDKIDNAPTSVYDENCIDCAEDIFNTWNGCRNYISLSVSHIELEAINTLATAVKSYAETEENSEYNAALASLRSNLVFLRNAETFSLDGIV